LESEIADFAGRNPGLIIPFWLADRRSYGLEQGNEKGPVLGVRGFRDLIRIDAGRYIRGVV
jgi:hypothetical protein